jgi:elongation factor 1-alpha
VGNELNPIIISQEIDVVEASRSILKDPIIPVFKFSNVSGKGLDLFKMFLHLLPEVNKYEDKNDESTEVICCKIQFYIERKYEKGEKIILGGTIIKGFIKKNQALYLGPD